MNLWKPNDTHVGIGYTGDASSGRPAIPIRVSLSRPAWNILLLLYIPPSILRRLSLSRPPMVFQLSYSYILSINLRRPTSFKALRPSRLLTFVFLYSPDCPPSDHCRVPYCYIMPRESHGRVSSPHEPQILDCILYKSAASLVREADLDHDLCICKNTVGCRSPFDARRRKWRCPWLRIQVYL